jgi:hypothetical protein
MTPGPWIAECVGDTGGENPVDVWEINNGYTRIAEYVSDKDARLIAAAPELLEVLKKLSRLAPSNEGLGGRAPLDAFLMLAHEARAAIAKAEGK